jgi:hypothetical protein
VTCQQYREQIDELQKRLDSITELCRRYNHPGCEPGTHALANKVLSLAEKHERKFA